MNNEHEEKVSALCFDFDRMFYDGIKVVKNSQLARDYAEWALNEGFSEKDIKDSFYLSLESCHIDATDERLRRNNHSLKYELTSTIYRSKERLKTKCEKITNCNKTMKETNEEKITYKRNPEIDEKLNLFMQENPKLVEFYNQMDKNELVRKACLQSMKRDEWKKRQALDHSSTQNINHANSVSIAM